MRRQLFLLLLLLLVFYIKCSEGTPISEASIRVGSIEHDLDTLQFKTAELIYQQIRESIISPYFPIDLFPVGIGRLAKRTEQDAATLSLVAHNMRSDWLKQKSSTNLFKDLVEGCSIYARIEVDELKESIEGVLIKKQIFDKSKQELREALIKNYSPKGFFESVLWQHGHNIRLGVCALMTFVSLIVAYAISWHWKSRRLRFVFVIMYTIAVVFVAYVSSVGLLRYLSAPEPVGAVWKKQSNVESYWTAFDQASVSINESIAWLDEYCQAMVLFNETVLNGIVSFSQKITELSTSRGSEDPIAALEIVSQSRERIEEQKFVLTKLSVSKSMKNKKTDLDQLLRFLSYFEMFFTQLEAQIYVNLKAGYDMNQFFLEHMSIMIDHIKDGNLVSCLTILTELHRQQLDQLSKLKQANTFVHHTNDAIAQIRAESTRLQPSLESEEFDSWLKKMAGKGSLAMAALPALGALGIPMIMTLPATGIGAAIALTGYYWTGYYEKAEKEARDIITELGKLDHVLVKVENSLSNHEKALSILMEEVASVLRNINHTEARFSYIQVRRSFSQREIDILSTGVNRLKGSVEVLTGRYQQSMNEIFNRIISKTSTTTTPPRSLPDRSSSDPAPSPSTLSEDSVQTIEEHTNHRIDHSNDEKKEL